MHVQAVHDHGLRAAVHHADLHPVQRHVRPELVDLGGEPFRGDVDSGLEAPAPLHETQARTTTTGASRSTIRRARPRTAASAGRRVEAVAIPVPVGSAVRDTATRPGPGVAGVLAGQRGCRGRAGGTCRP